MFEKVNAGHPDKMADRLAGAVVDLGHPSLCRTRESNRVRCRCCGNHREAGSGLRAG